MKQLIIIFNYDDFEDNIYDFFTFLKYMGKPFTGTVVDGNRTTEFKNGNTDGQSIAYFDNGQIASDGIYENGNYIAG
jgi:hypothetical protein